MTQDNIEFSIQNLRNVADMAQDYLNIYKREKANLENVAIKSHFNRIKAESQAMYMEDLIGHSGDISNYYSPKPRFSSVEEGKLFVLQLIQQTKQMPKDSLISTKQEEIKTFVEKLNEQNIQLQIEEQTIKRLKEDEAIQRQIDEEKHQNLLKQLNSASAEYKSIHQINKQKREVLRKKQKEIDVLKQKIQEITNETKNVEKEINILKQDHETLEQKRNEVRTQVNQIRDIETNLEKLRQQSIELTQVENDLKQKEQKITQDIDSKKTKIDQILTYIEQSQQGFVIPKFD